MFAFKVARRFGIDAYVAPLAVLGGLEGTVDNGLCGELGVFVSNHSLGL